MATPASMIPDDVRLNQTYAHRFARILVRPLLGTAVRPNHITLSRIIVGLASCGFLALGTVRSSIWSGMLWIIACVLDRADGELARIGNLRSESGKILDFYSDLILDSLWFLAAGMAASRHTLGANGIVLGVVTCVSLVACIVMAEAFERRSGDGVKAYYGLEQFHPDDALFLLPVFVWAGWLAPLLIASSAITPVVAAIIVIRYLRLRTAVRV